MLFEDFKKPTKKFLAQLILAFILLVAVLCFIICSVNDASKSNQELLGYAVKIRSSVVKLDQMFDRTEVNINMMVDSISSSYDADKQYNQQYNLKFVDGIDGLIKSVLSSVTYVDGSWFQLNAALPYSSKAYNWYEYKENQFVNVKDQFEESNYQPRKINPTEDPYYFGAITNQTPFWSDVYTDADTKNSMITLSAPVYKNGVLVGVVGIDISTANLQQILSNMQLILGDADLFLLNEKNKVILAQTLSNGDTLQEDYPFIEAFKESQEEAVEYYDGFTPKTAIMLTLVNGFKLVVSVKNSSLFTYSNGIVNLSYYLFVLLVILTGFVLFNQYQKMEVDAPVVVEEKQEETEE